ncbi:MAG: hypothetical protein ABFC84_14535 [Veillonellales bacterium]
MEEAGTALYEQMMEKLAILDKISINTKIQIRFIHQRKMKGLLRLLRERAQYLRELQEIEEKKLPENHFITENGAVKKMLLLIRGKQQEIIRDNKEALAAAVSEKTRIMADLQRLRSREKMNNSYNIRWRHVAGRRINQKG